MWDLDFWNNDIRDDWFIGFLSGSWKRVQSDFFMSVEELGAGESGKGTFLISGAYAGALLLCRERETLNLASGC
jgi:hypothetical protein